MEAVLPDPKLLKSANHIARRVLKRCELILKPKKSYDVAINPTKSDFVISKMNGASGHAYDNHTLMVRLSTKARMWKVGLAMALSHEFNHVIRYQYLDVDDADNFGIVDSIAFEGLAEVFEEEITGRAPPWAKAVSERTAKKMWKIMRTYKKGDYYSRFFPNGWQKRYPLWCGYTVAYLIAKRRKLRSNLSWRTMMALSAEEIVGEGLR